MGKKKGKLTEDTISGIQKREMDDKQPLNTRKLRSSTEHILKDVRKERSNLKIKKLTNNITL